MSIYGDPAEFDTWTATHRDGYGVLKIHCIIPLYLGTLSFPRANAVHESALTFLAACIAFQGTHTTHPRKVVPKLSGSFWFN